MDNRTWTSASTVPTPTEQAKRRKVSREGRKEGINPIKPIINSYVSASEATVQILCLQRQFQMHGIPETPRFIALSHKS